MLKYVLRLNFNYDNYDDYDGNTTSSYDVRHRDANNMLIGVISDMMLTTIMITVKISDSPMANDSSSFLALQAAAVATAADTPHTDMSAEITKFRDLDGIFRMY